jgi:glutamate--cysteine ligase
VPEGEAQVSPASEPIETEEALIDYFRAAETPVEEWRVGTEHEKIGVFRDTFERVPFDGERGIERLLERIAEQESWGRVFEDERLIALEKEGASITLEPGGQIELSGAPLRHARETCSEFNTHVEMVNRISADMGIVWLALGGDPIHPVSEIPQMPKRRYDIMRDYLPRQGGLALEMMHATATVQANFDYSNEADMVAKMRTSMACTGIVSAIFANSSFSLGKPNGHASRRVEVWRNTDSDRCGLLHFVFDPDFGYRRYREWALDIPVFFIVRDGVYHPGGRMTFREFLASGFEGQRATLEDWDLHLTTLFPEVRLKRIIEVRGADVGPRALVCALPVLWKGILYDAGACSEARALSIDWGREELEGAQIDVARRGLGAEIAGRPVLELARELVEISRAGLRAMHDRGEALDGEESFLDPIEAQLETGLSPGLALVEHWHGDWGESIGRLIDGVKY